MIKCMASPLDLLCVWWYDMSSSPIVVDDSADMKGVFYVVSYNQ